MSAPAPSRVSVLTPPGRGAIAVVAASGPLAFQAIDAEFQAANGRRLVDQAQDRIVFGHWSSGDYREEAVLIRGADAVEVHCHGGTAAVARIVDALAAHGCEELPWTNWLEDRGNDSITVEADVALAAATTRRTAAVLLDQRNGALARVIREIRGALERGDAADAQRSLSELMERSALGQRLTEPWQVAIAGRPNVGKSSLINALVGYQRAIVFDRPGTTRDVLAADTAIDGWPVRLTDAAGIRASDDPLESEGVARARDELRRADLALWVVDAMMLAGDSDVPAIARHEFAEATDASSAGVHPLVVVNKLDLREDLMFGLSKDVVPVSALTRVGLEELLRRISNRLVPSPPTPDEAVPFSSRQIERLQQAEAALKAGDLRAASARLDFSECGHLSPL
jgi:tRNA modification GTPase